VRGRKRKKKKKKKRRGTTRITRKPQQAEKYSTRRNVFKYLNIA
jgi:hypothetical protein